jgi:hypothetical protein
VHWINDPTPPEFRSYESLRDGVWDYLTVQMTRYPAAFAYLVANPADGPGWFARVVAGGYAADQSIVGIYPGVLSDLARRRSSGA